MDYCSCELPIKLFRHANYKDKQWYCSVCKKQVDPESKMLDKSILKLGLVNATRNEKLIQNKINELIELLKASGDLI